MRVFITGATGVIGSRAVPLLLQAGHAVTAASRSEHNREALRRAGATPADVDLFDVDSIRRAIAGHDVIINLATHIPSSAVKIMIRWAWRTNDRIRREASAAIATAAIAEGVGRMIQESFALIYPDSGDAWIDESMPVAPTSYNKSVLDAERSAQRFTESGRTGVVLRFGGLYGPDAMLAEMLAMMRKGMSPVPGDPGAYLSSLSQDDAATAVVAALGVPAGTYNVVEDEPMRREDWTRSLATAAGIPVPKPIPAWMTAIGGSMLKLMSRSERVSNRKFKEASGWAPKYPKASDAWGDVLRSLQVARAA
ncbi:MAG TPA: NAD(P)H-binding protein [Gemmatimonadaceae bacterium]|nr:NAD(P)H-binding protein [Gemmatimonadaceae bacterium]